MASTPDATVVGAGVIGLSSAIRLAEQGMAVRVVARELPQQTTSAVAAAIWYPYLIQPLDRALTWSSITFTEFERIAAAADSGVTMADGVEWLHETTPDPWWVSAVRDLRRPVERPARYADGWSFTTPLIEMPVYLAWLERRARDLGVDIEQRALRSLDELDADLVVNCTGLGSAALLGDAELTSVRGQVVLVDQIGLDRWYLDEDGPTYVIPRSRDIVLGGTDAVGATDLEPDSVIAADILRRATRLVPELADATVVGHRVGLRPARTSVRLERVDLDRRRSVVHCYGHGGAGVTVSWGCADEVAHLAAGAD